VLAKHGTEAHLVGEAVVRTADFLLLLIGHGKQVAL